MKVLPSLSQSIRSCFRTLIIASPVLIFANLAHAQSVEYVVVSLEGEQKDYKLGQILLEGQTIKVNEGVTIQLVGKSGEFLALQGPIVAVVTNDDPEKKAETTLVKISQLLFDENKFVETLGATRSLDHETNLNEVFPKSKINNPWVPTLADNKTYCVARHDPVLQRTQKSKALTVKLSSGTTTKKVEWQRGSDSLSLREKINATDDTYTVQLSPEGKEFEIHIGSMVEFTKAEQIAWLAERGCKLQALMLLSQAYQE